MLATSLIIIILLAILILGLSSVLKNLSGSELLLNLLKKKEDDKKSTAGTSLLLIFTLLASSSAFAQENTVQAASDGRVGGIDGFTFYTMLFVIFLELIVTGVLITTLKYLLRVPASKETQPVIRPKEKTILDKLSGAVELEKEESILLDHDYDGIKELDNDLPPWWKYGFYLTILVSVVYMVNYHITKTSPLQQEEYTMSMKKAEAEIAEFMKNSANNVDENTVKLLDNTSDLTAGKDLFIANCAACHGRSGEGTVGPNLTDDYWLHSGGLKDIFKSIKYGWPDKGMKSWKEDFSPVQIAQIASFIKTLRGSNPAKQKEKQGDLYTEEVLSTDTLLTKDSLNIISANTKPTE